MAHYKTFGTLRQDVIKRLGLVPGTSVQTYAEPQVEAAIQDMFDFLWDKHQWPHLWKWHTFTLNGTTGLTTEDWTGIRRYEDIAVVRKDRGRGIPIATNTEHQYVTGSDALYREILTWDDASAETKFFKFYPITATGTIEVFAGHKPEDFVDTDDIVPFDPNLMILGSVWYALNADGLNEAAAGSAQALFDARFTDYMVRINPTEIGNGRGFRNQDTVFISE